MLTLTREIGQDVDLVLPDGRIGRVRLVSVSGGGGDAGGRSARRGNGGRRVRLGFDFPTDVVIRREELRPESKGDQS